MNLIKQAILENKETLSNQEYREYFELQKKAYVPGRERAKSDLMREVVLTYLVGHPLPKEANILDVGCGTGTLLSVFKKLKFTSLFGVDINEDKLYLAKEEHPNIHGCDMEEMKMFDDDFFDFVISFHTLEHAWNLDKSLAELSRVMKPKAPFFFILPNEPNNTNSKGKGNAHTHPFCSKEQIVEEFSLYFVIDEIKNKATFEPEFFVTGRNK